MNKPLLACLIALLVMLPVLVPAAPRERLSPEVALKQLMDGNRRFAEATPHGPHRSVSRLQEVARGQEPFAAILGCADSRVPPEIIFDQGIGNLFVARNAGNVEDNLVLGTLEYAAEHLHVSLILVLGHKSCGAVTAAMDGGHHNGHIDDFIKAIEPAVAVAKEKNHDDLEDVVRINARLIAARLAERSDVLSKLIDENKLKIIGGYYDLDTGRVTLLSDE